MRRRSTSFTGGPAVQGGLRRAIGYLALHRLLWFGILVAVLVATLSQLAIPQLVQNILDAVMQGAQAKALGKAADERAIIVASLAIIGFSVVRAVFSFLQGYLAEVAIQSVAFDFRNEIFAKIQRLSFSYHDQNQTGQLMVRATDDVEKVRLFIGQGLVMALQSVVLLVGTLVILFAHQLPADAGDSAHSAARDGLVHGLQLDQPAVVYGRADPPVDA